MNEKAFDELAFSRQDRSIRVRFVGFSTLSEISRSEFMKIMSSQVVVLLSLRLNWQILPNENQEEERALKQALEDIPGIAQLSLATSHLLVLKAEDAPWEKVISGLVNCLFDFEEKSQRCLQARRLIEKSFAFPDG